jgi:cell wall-associated NlpC family hydrolase
MQFEPSTFAEYKLPVPPGGANPPSPYDPVDAVYAAARDLCTNGARNGTDLPAAVYAYNRSSSYVQQVLALTAQLTTGGGTSVAADETPAAAIAVAYAQAQLGTPYQWGGDGPGGFDCSGLTLAAYQAAGIQLPRTAQQQYNAGPPVPAGQPLQPGDLVFFGSNPGHIDHVGILINSPEMIDAPHSGAVVRVEPYQWGDYVGATRPAS